ncbi:MAG: hypothetical protein A2W25_03765 [candidate division Zixibacteria bacterium RBG_16_53_22]|nr:MAG: hypothetical protein A2W25_03765 [candidate division Zixibacteria bacterium RBG_16_53_22]
MKDRIPLILTAILMIHLPASALPRFGAQYEQKCNLCHVSPSGGGMRNAYGSQYFAQTELAAHKLPMEEISKFQPNVSDNILIGMDGRTLYIHDESLEQSSFFQMEGNFYLDAQVTPKFNVSVFKGLYSGFEIFGTGYYLPLHGYIRAGKFQPSYGWRFEDHTSFVREKMLWPPNSYDTGMEIGFYPQGISANIGMFNGTGGQLDNDRGKAVAARLEYRLKIVGLGLGLAGSFWQNDRTSGRIDMYGPAYYLKAWQGKLIYLGELDWLDDKGSNTKLFATTQSLAFRLTQGIWIEGKYDFHDPDVDLKSGATSRYSLSIDYFPIGFLELEPSLRFYNDDVINDDYVIFIQQFHFFF